MTYIIKRWTLGILLIVSVTELFLFRPFSFLPFPEEASHTYFFTLSFFRMILFVLFHNSLYFLKQFFFIINVLIKIHWEINLFNNDVALMLIIHLLVHSFLCQFYSIQMACFNCKLPFWVRNPPYTRSNSGGSSRLRWGVKTPHFDVHSFRKRMKKWTFWTFERLFSAA